MGQEGSPERRQDLSHRSKSSPKLIGNPHGQKHNMQGHHNPHHQPVVTYKKSKGGGAMFSNLHVLPKKAIIRDFGPGENSNRATRQAPKRVENMKVISRDNVVVPQHA